MTDKNKNIINGISVIGSIIGYELAKNNKKIDKIPAMLISGFLSRIIANNILK